MSTRVEIDRLRPLSQRLREPALLDSEFDLVYPPPVRAMSWRYWTPICVARRAAELLVRGPSTRVLDVGSGIGKFCILGTAMTGAQFIGIEHRQHLVRTARAAAISLGTDSARFVHGTFEKVDITTFDALYLFNPFEENLWGEIGHIDDTVELSRERFIADVAHAERLLRAARIGTRVVTYHGFGGDMPPGFRRLVRERRRGDYLDLWIKATRPDI